MKKIAIVGGIAMMSFGAGNIIWHKQKPKLGTKELAIASGEFFLTVGFSYRF